MKSGNRKNANEVLTKEYFDMFTEACRRIENRSEENSSDLNIILTSVVNMIKNTNELAIYAFLTDLNELTNNVSEEKM